MSFPHLLCCSFLTQQECGSNSILIKYFLEAKNHLPPQRRAHCYALSSKSISWLWGHKYLLISQMHCLVVFGWVRNWLLTIWVSHRLDIPVQWVTWLLEASYQICMPSISAQINLERSSVLLFFGVTCYLLHSAKPSHGYLLRATMAKIQESFAQAFPPKPKFRIEDIPDLSDKVIVVTGMSGHQIGNLSCHIY